MDIQETENSCLKGKKILIAEDDVFIARVYTRWLTKCGAVSVVVNDGSRCLEVLDEEKVDLLLLDLGMPGLSGYDTLSQLRCKPHLKNLPVIILTNTTIDENMVGLDVIKSAGVKDVLQKYNTPLTQLIDCIAKYLCVEAH